MGEVTSNRLRARAYSRALSRLRDAHPQEFAELLAEEKATVKQEPGYVQRGRYSDGAPLERAS